MPVFRCWNFKDTINRRSKKWKIIREVNHHTAAGKRREQRGRFCKSARQHLGSDYSEEGAGQRGTGGGGVAVNRHQREKNNFPTGKQARLQPGDEVEVGRSMRSTTCVVRSSGGRGFRPPQTEKVSWGNKEISIGKISDQRITARGKNTL